MTFMRISLCFVAANFWRQGHELPVIKKLGFVGGILPGNCVSRDYRVASGSDEVADLIQRNLALPGHSPADGDASRRLTSTRREALSLYRQVFRVSRLFVWRDQHGALWRDLIRESARKEFEAARFETDPEMFMVKREKIIEEEASRAF
eukprot:jgi/Mesen1/9097/ME000058S08583